MLAERLSGQFQQVFSKVEGQVSGLYNTVSDFAVRRGTEASMQLSQASRRLLDMDPTAVATGCGAGFIGGLLTAGYGIEGFLAVEFVEACLLTLSQVSGWNFGKEAFAVSMFVTLVTGPTLSTLISYGKNDG